MPKKQTPSLRCTSLDPLFKKKYRPENINLSMENYISGDIQTLGNNAVSQRRILNTQWTHSWTKGIWTWTSVWQISIITSEHLRSHDAVPIIYVVNQIIRLHRPFTQEYISPVENHRKICGSLLLNKVHKARILKNSDFQKNCTEWPQDDLKPPRVRRTYIHHT